MKSNFQNLLGSAIAAQKNEFADIKSKIIVKTEFKNLIPPLTEEEFSQLESNILSEGIREPILLWNNGDDYILVDGHNRFSISQKHGIDFQFTVIPFKDEEEVRDAMIRWQLGRRNLSPEQQSYLRGLRYNREKVQGKRTDLTLDQSDPKSGQSTAALLGKEFNVSEATIKRDGIFAEGVDAIGKDNPELRQQILSGDTKLSKKEISSIAKQKGLKNATGLGEKKSRISAKEVAAIAFQYIQAESRTIEEIYSALGKKPGSLEPQEYFILWKALTLDGNS